MRLLRIKRSTILFLCALAAAATGPARAVQGDANPAAETAPVTVEIFLSQACERCPPAADYMVDLAKRPDVVALGWHVDYWNMMMRGDAGNWSDPFSKISFSERQRRYNRNIRKRNTVFTPQAIIDGVKTTVGSNRKAVESLIKAAKAEPMMAPHMTRKGDTIDIAVDGGDEPCEAILVTFLRNARTPVTGGDNAGLTFVEANVVTNVLRLGVVGNEGAEFVAPAPDEGRGCALLLQEPEQGRILSAAYCPAKV